MLTSSVEKSIAIRNTMVAVRLPFRGLDVSSQQIQGSNTHVPQHRHQQQPQSQANSWVQDIENGLIIVTCCQDDSPYHKLICGHLIYSQSKGCGRTCRAAINSAKNLRTEFCCDRCSDEQTLDETMEEIRKHWSEMILENRILLLDHLQPYIDAFEYHLKLGRRARTGRRGRKAFARSDEELVENFQVQIEELIERSCYYFLELLMERKGSNMYDELGEDGDESGDEDSREELSDEVEEGQIENSNTEEDASEEKLVNFPDLTAALSLRPHPQSAAGVQHKLSVVESLLGSVDLGDSFGSVEEAIEAEEDRMAAQIQCSIKRVQSDGLRGDEVGKVRIAPDCKKARIEWLGESFVNEALDDEDFTKKDFVASEQN
jgi:hypothetical protein